MKRPGNYSNLLIILSIVIGLLFIYKQVVLSGKILFPSNFLAQFYSPWRTEKFSDWETGIPHKPIGDDQIRLFYPERTFTNEMLAKNTIPLWNPYVFAGTPFLADFQSGIFYPLNILYFFLPQIYAWEILLFIQPIMATFFMYLFLSLFRLKKQALWLGAISFGFSGFMLVWNQENVVVGQAALWLPLVLLGIEGFLTKNNRWYYLIAVFALACSFLAGFSQVTFYIFLFSFFYSLFRIKNLKLPFFPYALKTIGIYIFSLCLSAIQLLPSIEAFLESPRSTSSVWYLFEDYLLPITHVFNAFVPDIFGNPGAYNFFGRGFYRETIFYAGLIPLVFAIYASFKAKLDPVIRFFVSAAFVSFFLTLDSPFTRWFFQLPLPLIPTFLPSRIFILTTFSLSALSAFGFSAWIKQGTYRDKKMIFYILLSFLFILFLIALYAIFMLSSYERIIDFKQFNEYIIRPWSIPKKTDFVVMLRNLLLPFFMIFSLGILTIFKKGNIFTSFVIILTLLGQFYFLNKYLVVGDSEFLYPKNAVISFLQSRNSLDRFLTLREPMEENISMYAHIYSVEGVNPVFPRRYGELLFAVKNNGKITRDIPRVEARLSELGEKENPFGDNRRMRLFSLLGIKYVLYFDDHNPKNSGANKYPENLFKPIWQYNNWYGLEYTKAFPRSFLVSRIHIQTNPQKIVDLLFDKNFDLSSNMIIEKKPAELFSSNKNLIDLQKASLDSLAKIMQYEPQKIQITTKTDKPQMLFLSDNYYPGWKAYVDNRETKIYRANYAFRGIYLPEGNHLVKFIYDPMSFKIGLVISVLSVIVLLLVILKNSNLLILKDNF